MKANNYIQPTIEVVAVSAAYTICAESVFGNFTNGGGTDIVDPISGGL